MDEIHISNKILNKITIFKKKYLFYRTLNMCATDSTLIGRML